MASRYWIKLYIEILDDPKMGKLPPDLWRFTVELFLLAGEMGCNGTLPSCNDVSWRLRYTVTQCNNWIDQLLEIGILKKNEADEVTVANFAKRQGASPVNERVRQHRERKKKETEPPKNDVTEVKRKVTPESESESESESFKERKLQRPPVIPAVQVHVQETGKYCLSQPQAKEVERRIGHDPPQLDQWRQVVRTWIMRGYKPTNVDGMLDWFDNGIPQNGNGAHDDNKRNQTQPAGNRQKQATGLDARAQQISAALKARARTSGG